MGFAQRGGAVAVADINGANANRVVDEITSAGGKAIPIVADVTHAGDIDMMITRTVHELGRLDFLHNNAFGFSAIPGVSGAAATGDTDDRMWNATLDVGLTAVFRAMKRAIPVMRAQGSGSIVNTASISGLYADYGIVAYNAAKAGVVNLTRVAAIEYARMGIRVNCICPGAIDTPLLSGAAQPEMIKKFHEIIPMGRLGRP
jgi:meso-butanediol dehydrogenase/(S,S)-butanediol dehydrogenase/diacetyl reductase